MLTITEVSSLVRARSILLTEKSVSLSRVWDREDGRVSSFAKTS